MNKDELQTELEETEAEIEQALEDSLGIEDPFVLYLRRRVKELKEQINPPASGWVM